QDRFLHSSVRLVLFLCRVGRRVQLAHRQQATIFLFGGNLLDRSVILPYRAVIVVVERRLLKSFRVGIDADHPDRLITDGVFAFTRNPIYVAFAIILIGEFFILPNWITLIYMAAATWLLHRQVLREEDYLRRHYSQAYVDYCNRVRRYF